MPEARAHASRRSGSPLREDESVAIADLMNALAAPSRVRLLFALREGERSVGDLADATALTPSAASQQLRILRHLRFVRARRDGRSTLYRLHDDHVAVLLDEVRNHLEHAGLGWE